MKKIESGSEPTPLTVRIPQDVHNALRIVAKENNQSVNSLIVKIIRDWFRQRSAAQEGGLVDGVTYMDPHTGRIGSLRS